MRHHHTTPWAASAWRTDNNRGSPGSLACCSSFSIRFGFLLVYDVCYQRNSPWAEQHGAARLAPKSHSTWNLGHIPDLYHWLVQEYAQRPNTVLTVCSMSLVLAVLFLGTANQKAALFLFPVTLTGLEHVPIAICYKSHFCQVCHQRVMICGTVVQSLI